MSDIPVYISHPYTSYSAQKTITQSRLRYTFLLYHLSCKLRGASFVRQSPEQYITASDVNSPLKSLRVYIGEEERGEREETRSGAADRETIYKRFDNDRHNFHEKLRLRINTSALSLSSRSLFPPLVLRALDRYIPLCAAATIQVFIVSVP